LRNKGIFELSRRHFILLKVESSDVEILFEACIEFKLLLWLFVLFEGFKALTNIRMCFFLIEVIFRIFKIQIKNKSSLFFEVLIESFF
jgi:hypothetical protein